NAVAKVPGGRVVVRRWRCSEDREVVGRSGTKPSPVFEDTRVLERGQHADRGEAKALDGFGDGALVESDFLHGGSGEETSVGARNQVNLGRPHHVAQQFSLRHGEANHLAFDRAGREWVRYDLASPGSGAVHDFAGAIR